MKIQKINTSEFVFQNDFIQCCQPQYEEYCLHLLCLEGRASFSMGDGHYEVKKGDAVIKSAAKPITGIQCSDDFRIKALLISNHILEICKPESSYNAIGMFSTMQNPVMQMNKVDMERCLRNFEEIRLRLEQPYHNFFAEIMKRSVETMILDFYDIHVRHSEQKTEGVTQASIILQRFINMLQEGSYKQERSVDYYAALLCITPKYLSQACLAVSGYNASTWIEHFTKEELARLLSDKTVPMKQIADDFNFSSIAYFSRYVKRLFGMSPSEYRKWQK